MPGGSQLCPSCNKLNARTDRRCVRCGRWLPGGALRPLGAVRRWLGEETPVTRGAVALCVLVWLAMLLVGEGSLLGSVGRRAAVAFGALVGELGSYQPWRYLTATFVHFSLMHLGFNSAALYSLGQDVERGLGSARLTVVLLLSGVGGYLASDVWYGWSAGALPPTAGASAGLFGLFGVGAGWRLALGDPAWKRVALNGLGYALLWMLLGGMLGAINHAAHLGGLFSGGGLGFLLFRVRNIRQSRRIVRSLAWALGAIAVLGIVVNLITTGSLLTARGV